MDVFILLIWVACAALCYSQAQKKNLNTGLWAVLGLFFGVFAVIGVLVAKPRA